MCAGDGPDAAHGVVRVSADHTGEGAYEGLVLHYYVAGTDEELAWMGWIAPVE